MIDYKDYGKCWYGNYSLWLEILAAVAMASAVGLIFYQLKFHPSNNGQLDCSQCHSKELQTKNKLSEYFRKNGSKTPEEMANAVLKTRNPRLLAAMAVRESGGNHRVRSTGYKSKHDGAFQVNKKHWGKVPHDAIGQALQAEAILTELIEVKGDIKSALNSYGGDRTKKVYAANILKELQEVPR